MALAIIISFTQVNAQKAKEKVDMAFDKTVDGNTAHDFGSIMYGANGKVDFNFTNQGTKPISITNVESSCGCTVPTWTKEPVEPGKQGTITIVYNTTLPGAFNKTVVVTSNANNSPVRLEIRGKINATAADIQQPAVNAGVVNEATQKAGSDDQGHVREGNKQLQEQKAAQVRAASEQTASGAKPAVTVTKPAVTPIKKK